MEINESGVDQDSTAYIGLQANRSTCKHFMKYTALQHKVLVLITKS